MKTRDEIADELMTGCPDCECDSLIDPENDPEQCEHCDHEDIADAIRSNMSWTKLSHMKQLNAWPDTYVWVRAELSNIENID